MAERLVVSTVICDPSGCAYMSYKYDLIRMFLIVEYYTNVDISDWNTEDGQQAIFDYMTRSGDSPMSRYEKMCENEAFCHDLDLVENIFSLMSEAMMYKHEHSSTLSYKLGKAFESFIDDGNILKSLEEKNEINEKMLDLFSAYNEKRQRELVEKSDSKPLVSGVFNFAKK